MLALVDNAYNIETLISDHEIISDLAILLLMVFVVRTIMILIFTGEKNVIVKLCTQASSAEKLNLNY